MDPMHAGEALDAPKVISISFAANNVEHLPIVPHAPYLSKVKDCILRYEKRFFGSANGLSVPERAHFT